MKYDIIYSIATDTIRNRVLNKVNINQNDTNWYIPNKYIF